MKPHIWYSTYHDAYFVGFRNGEPTSKYRSLRDVADDWPSALDWFRKREKASGGTILVKLPQEIIRSQ